MRCLSLVQQTALMNSDRDCVDLLIGLNPSEKDLPYRLVFGLVFYDKSVVNSKYIVIFCESFFMYLSEKALEMKGFGILG